MSAAVLFSAVLDTAASLKLLKGIALRAMGCASTACVSPIVNPNEAKIYY